MRPPFGDEPAPGTDFPSIAFLATYVPRQCGIATFTRDLVEGLRADRLTYDGLQVVAMERRGEDQRCKTRESHRNCTAMQDRRIVAAEDRLSTIRRV